jgi:hypothetical protein
MAKSSLRKISAPQSYVGSAAGFNYNGDDIVSVRFFGHLNDPSIDSRRSYDLALFANVHGGFGRGDFVARPGFDFDESQCEWARRFIIGDDVNLACDLAAVFAVADWSDVICGDYAVAMLLEMPRDQPLAVFSQRQMRWAPLVFIFAESSEKLR